MNMSRKPNLTRVGLFTIPLFFSLAVAALFYPGFMSYDTVHALDGARQGVHDSMWPPMVSYVWRVIDLVSKNPSAMHFFQVFLLLFSIFFIVFGFTKKISNATLFLVLYLSIPVILGTVAVIWKDVLMAAFFLSSFVMMISIKAETKKLSFIFLTVLAFFLIVLGTCSRHNAVTAAVPMLFYLASRISRRMFQKPLHILLGMVFIAISFISITFFTKIQLDHYSLPDFVRLNSSTDEFIQTVRVLDVAGASLCANKNLFSSMSPNLTVAKIKKLYEPRHINLSEGLIKITGFDARINALWLHVATHHPICFFYNKMLLTQYLLGANKGEQFLITAPAIDSNQYGYTLRPSLVRDSTVGYIVKASLWPWLKPWFLYCISLIMFFIMVFKKRVTIEQTTLLISAIFYFLSLVMFGNAADARLPFYTTTILVLLAFIYTLNIFNTSPKPCVNKSIDL